MPKVVSELIAFDIKKNKDNESNKLHNSNDQKDLRQNTLPDGNGNRYKLRRQIPWSITLKLHSIRVYIPWNKVRVNGKPVAGIEV